MDKDLTIELKIWTASFAPIVYCFKSELETAARIITHIADNYPLERVEINSNGCLRGSLYGRQFTAIIAKDFIQNGQS